MSSVCDKEVAAALADWGFAHLQPNFAKHKIDINAFVVLDEDTIDIIVPDENFLHTFRNRVSELGAGAPSSSKRKLNSVLTEDSNAHSKSRRVTPSVAAGPSRASGAILLNNTVESNIDSVVLDVDVIDWDFVESCAEEIRELLDKSFPGRVLLATPVEDLTDSDRLRIAEIIICHELWKGGRDATVSSKRLTELANAVVKVFPGETPGIYYVPFRTAGKLVYQAKGKYVSQLYGWRSRGVAVNLLDKLQHFRSQTSTSTATPLNDEIEKSSDWLRVNLGPLALVQLHWEITYPFRSCLWDDNNFSVEKYLSTYPVLRQPYGLDLVVKDFNRTFPESADNFSLNFKDFAAKLIKKLTAKLIGSDALAATKQLFESLNQVDNCHHFLQYLSKIYPEQCVVKGRKPNNWTATKAEVQNGFLYHASSEADLHEYIQIKVKKLSSFKKPLQFQPFAAIVGPELSRIEKSYVVLQAHNLYPVNSPSEAIDKTFKSFHVLNVKYPPESKVLWRTLQKIVYKIHVPEDDVDVVPALLPILSYFNRN